MPHEDIVANNEIIWF